MLVAYEVQIYESGDWQIASMFNERELALMEARRIEEGLRRKETRVVEETHDEDSGRTRSKVIYTTPKLRSQDSPPAQATAQAKTPANKPKSEPRQTSRGTRHRPPAAAAKSEPNLMIMVLTFVLIVGLGIAGIVGLRFLSGLG